MRYAIISDIHANESALRAVLTDAADARAEKIVCLGDVLGYGPEPVQALELIYRRAHVCLAGNHDDAVAGRFPTTDFTPFAEAAVKRHRDALSGEAINWLRKLPHVCEFPAIHEGLDGAFACAHGEFADPKNFNYVLDPEDAMPSWMQRTEQLLFVGHTHNPGIFVLGESGIPHMLEPSDFVLEPGKRYLVNVGSVGYPRNGVCRSFYCIYDDLSRAVFFRSLPFDVEAYSAKMHGQGLDEAPWIKVREKERQRQEVRGEAHFGKTDEKAGKAPHVVIKRLPPRKAELDNSNESVLNAAPVKAAEPAKKVTIKPIGKGAITPPKAVLPGSTVVLRVPEGIKPGLAPSAPAPKSHGGLVPAIIVGALVVALAGIWCTYSLVKSIPKKPRAPGAVSVTMAGAANNASNGPQFRELQRLAENWSATFEMPESQKVSDMENLRHECTGFRLESPKFGTIRLSKRLYFIEKPEKIYWTVRLAPGSSAGGNFSFNVRVRCLNARGMVVDEMSGSGKRSATNKSITVPPGTISAMMEIDCRCEGTYELEVPYFRTDPDERRSR